ncbi:pectin lyase fold/virulence factor [Suillus fuscotomentosus]|uniref:galacturonan 1,4-alpha-galacturonidase n=1 Tax=Suillus fuscotomentosus TaxID=1912939 RepID=A0AAD4HKS5_9AGAM|nr:pectin lyase fold/virulence factor [Suillus fuscotomentosus]KAG1899084.1 pectin lyase fold/virulence factor [Suillus fuscotomentosus]
MMTKALALFEDLDVPLIPYYVSNEDEYDRLEGQEHCTLLFYYVILTISPSGLQNLLGTIRFTSNMSYWINNGFPFEFQDQIAFWIVGGQNILINGGGTIDGSGQVWYDTFANNSTFLCPILLTIYQATDVAIKNITMINSPEWFNFNQVLSILAWASWFAHAVFVLDSTNVIASDLYCNGSHGISVGSLGQYAGVYDIVENFTSTNVQMYNAQNGAHIKAFACPGVGSGIVKNITFSFFIEGNVDNPLIVDQRARVHLDYHTSQWLETILLTSLTFGATAANRAQGSQRSTLPFLASLRSSL